MSKSFVHIHSSSRYDRSKASLRNATTRYNRRADLVTYTEVEREYREDVIRKVNGEEFGFVSGDNSDADDCGISYRRSRFKLVYSEQYQHATQEVFFPNGKPRKLPWATIAVLDDIQAGRRVVIAVAHFTAAVETELWRNNSTYRRVIQWRQSAKNIKRRTNRLAKKFKADARIVCGDWNVNYKRPWVQALIKAIAPKYRCTVKNPNFSTHGGGRLIDFTILRGKMDGDAKAFRDDNSSDHAPYIETLTWR